MTDDPVDLTPLAPDQLQVERATRAILQGAQQELRRRQLAAQVTPTPLTLLAAWHRPLIAASALIALPGVIALGMERQRDLATDPTVELATALGVPVDFLPQLLEDPRQ